MLKTSGEWTLQEKTMERSRGTLIFATLVIIYGAYNLIGIGSLNQFSIMFKPLSKLLITIIYVFTILYGICGVYCGARILKLEDWARKVIVGMTTISVILGLLLNKTVMANLKEFLASGQSNITPDMTSAVYTYAVMIAAVSTIFEMAIIYYFTRPGVTRQFKRS